MSATIVLFISLVLVIIASADRSCIDTQWSTNTDLTGIRPSEDSCTELEWRWATWDNARTLCTNNPLCNALEVYPASCFADNTSAAHHYLYSCLSTDATQLTWINETRWHCKEQTFMDFLVLCSTAAPTVSPTVLPSDAPSSKPTTTAPTTVEPTMATSITNSLSQPSTSPTTETTVAPSLESDTVRYSITIEVRSLSLVVVVGVSAGGVVLCCVCVGAVICYKRRRRRKHTSDPKSTIAYKRVQTEPEQEQVPQPGAVPEIEIHGVHVQGEEAKQEEQKSRENDDFANNKAEGERLSVFQESSAEAHSDSEQLYNTPKATAGAAPVTRNADGKHDSQSTDATATSAANGGNISYKQNASTIFM